MIRIPVGTGMRLQLLNDQEWEAGKVKAGAVGTVYRTRLPAGSVICAIQFDDVLPRGGRHFGIPPEVSEKEYAFLPVRREL